MIIYPFDNNAPYHCFATSTKQLFIVFVYGTTKYAIYKIFTSI